MVRTEIPQMGGESSLGEEYVGKTNNFSFARQKIEYWILRWDEPSGFYWLHRETMASSTYHRVLVFHRASPQAFQAHKPSLILQPFNEGCFSG